MPLQQTSGNVTADAYGGGVPFTPTYIEEIFSTWLYTGNGSTQTITNGIDLAGKGGMVWVKCRSTAYNNVINSTGLSGNSEIITNTTDPQNSNTSFSGFTSSGFGVTAAVTNSSNTNGDTYVSWAFREQPKFFDVVTFTGNNTANQSIAHNLGSVPGCIFIKAINTTDSLYVYHQSLGKDFYLRLNATASANNVANVWGTSAATSTNFFVSNQTVPNTGNPMVLNGQTYVAYVFAHNAGGFGLTGTDNVISCGSFTGSGAGVATTVTLGYEPQFIIAKRTDAAQNWIMFDNMRGFDNTNAARLFPNLSNAESTVPAENYFTPTATGFKYGPGNSMGDTANIIYIAIRRGPMKVPTDGTKVFAPVTITGTGSSRSITTPGFPVDLAISKVRNTTFGWSWEDRLRGAKQELMSNNTDVEYFYSDGLTGFDSMVGYALGADSSIGRWNYSGGFDYGEFALRRAPGFFDVVCYTGTGSTTAYTHNLGVAPELMIVKSRNDPNDWAVYCSALGNTKYAFLNNNLTPASTYPIWANTTPTATTFTTNGTYNWVGGGGITYVAYLFASCPGVSKVGSYTGNGGTQTINCGFAGGARFVRIRRTDDAGAWFVWDTARGMVSGNDPFLRLNSTLAESGANYDSVATTGVGFTVTQSDAAMINVSSASYIYLAIA